MFPAHWWRLVIQFIFHNFLGLKLGKNSKNNLTIVPPVERMVKKAPSYESPGWFVPLLNDKREKCRNATVYMSVSVLIKPSPVSQDPHALLTSKRERHAANIQMWYTAVSHSTPDSWTQTNQASPPLRRFLFCLSFFLPLFVVTYPHISFILGLCPVPLCPTFGPPQVCTLCQRRPLTLAFVWLRWEMSARACFMGVWDEVKGGDVLCISNL